MQIKARKKVLRQVFWLSGHHHFASLPEFTLSGKEIQNDSLITAAGAAPELKFIKQKTSHRIPFYLEFRLKLKNRMCKL